MGFNEYNFLKETLLDVKNLSDEKNNLHSEITSLNNKISDLKNNLKESNNIILNLESRNSLKNLEITSKKLEQSKIKLKSQEDSLTAEERNKRKILPYMGYGFLWVSAIAIIDVHILGGNDDLFFASIPGSIALCCLPFYFIGAGALTVSERENVELEIKSTKNEINSLSRNLGKEIKIQKEYVFGIERRIEQYLQMNVQSHHQIKVLEEKINKKMDSISHLIPYADKID
jgi:hypothetical protein